MWQICTMEYYSTMENSKALTRTTMWMNLEDIVLSERSQSQNVKYCMSPFMVVVTNGQMYRNRKSVSSWQGRGGEDKGSGF